VRRCIVDDSGGIDRGGNSTLFQRSVRRMVRTIYVWVRGFLPFPEES
jgi:hypothetical protein